MCGRYHIDEEMTEEIRRMVKILESRLNAGSRDIYPSMEAPVILKNEGEGLKAASMAWGFPGRDKKQLLINARAETALERPSFSRAVSHRRCVIPARGFMSGTRKKKRQNFPEQTAPFYIWPDSTTCFRKFRDLSFLQPRQTLRFVLSITVCL